MSHEVVEIDIVEVATDGQLKRRTDSLLSHSSASMAAYEELNAALAPKKHHAVCGHLPLVAVVLAISALAVFAPVLSVWGINVWKMRALSVIRRDEALRHRATSIHDDLYHNVHHCELLISTHTQYLDALPRASNGRDDYDVLMLNSSWAWAMPMRDPLCGGALFVFGTSYVLMVNVKHVTLGAPIVRIQQCDPAITPNCTFTMYRFDPANNKPLDPIVTSPGLPVDMYIAQTERTPQIHAQWLAGRPVWTQITPIQAGFGDKLGVVVNL
jgi:hypothetical protein